MHRNSFVWKITWFGLPFRGLCLALWLGVFFCNSFGAPGNESSNVKTDYEVIFFPSAGYRMADGKGWELEIRGCVYEEDRRRLALALLRDVLKLKGVQLTQAENALFTQRARLFMVDHKGRRKIVVRICGKDFELVKTRTDGLFSGLIHLSDADVRGFSNMLAQVSAVLPPKDERSIFGEISLLDTRGITVISDIDDTIKVTRVNDRKALMRNTFLSPFEAVPGMANLYRTWADKSQAQFCYVSASPWQLLLPLEEFTRSNGFPAGPFYLKQFRWKDQSFLSLFENPEKYKPEIIEPMLKRFPERRFVLVGDSGERDPEIYGALARKYPEQVARILIREVSGEAPDSERYRVAFRDLPLPLWRVFSDPAEVLDACPESSK